MKKTILITGGAGFIGSHTYIILAAAGYDLIILDNLSNSKLSVISRIAQISGTNPIFFQDDILDFDLMDHIFSCYSIGAVIHFAGLKSVSESVKSPNHYYENNISGTINLLKIMLKYDVKTLVFSSSATVYGKASKIPISENSPRAAINPYGRSKLIIEDMLSDLHRSDDSWRIALLRYFNPVGAHDSGLIGEEPMGEPSNLFPYIAQVAANKRDYLKVWGSDYNTPDGTGIRDYIHVCDLAEGHLAALSYLQKKNGGVIAVNLGTGIGSSVLEVIRAYEIVSRSSIPYRMFPPRLGDVAECWADVSLAKKILGWEAKRGLVQMCEDSWRWQKNHDTKFS